MLMKHLLKLIIVPVITLPILPIISCNNLATNSHQISFDQEWSRILTLQPSIKFKDPQLNLQTLWDIHHNPNLIWNFLNQDFRQHLQQFQYLFTKIEFPFVNEMQAFFKLVDPLTNQFKMVVFNFTFQTIHSWTSIN